MEGALNPGAEDDGTGRGPEPAVRAPFAVREARPEDLPAMAMLWDELDAEQTPWRVFAPRPGLRDDIVRSFAVAIASPDALVVVAEGPGGLVGMAKASVTRPSTLSEEVAVELSSVVVRGDRRRRGVGVALVRAVAGFASGRGLRRVTIRVFSPNEGGIRFWEALGFAPRAVQMTADAATLLDLPEGPLHRRE